MLQTLNKPIVYYSGNTWQNPGDILTVSGYQIGLQTQKVRLYKLEDTAVQKECSYIASAYYDKVLNEKELSNAVTPKFENKDSTQIDVLQCTEDSIKFKIPVSSEKGVYAVKLAMDTAADSDDAIVYINQPKINFCLGNEGVECTPGGWLRIIGINLAPQEAPNPVRVFIKNENLNQELKVTKTQSIYSVEVAVPDTLAKGQYELFLHNGFGGDTAWSQPLSLTVGSNPRDSWPDTVFNVKDYGAKGIGPNFNDTPGIIRALRAAKENGGGVVYVPRGTYMLIYQLDIPENVIIKGEGIRRSKILFIPYNWDIGKLPESIFNMTGNVAVEGIDFTGTRLGALFSAKGKNAKNIYIRNCRVYLTPFVGPASESAPVGNGIECPYLWYPIHKEMDSYRNWNGNIIFKIFGAKNVQISDNYIDTEGSGFHFGGCEGVYLSHNKFNLPNGTLFGCINSIMEDNELDGSGCSVSGDNIYFACNTLKNTDLNNRELMTTDGPGVYGNSRGETYMQTLDDAGIHFRLEQRFSAGALVGKQLLIQEGIGEGQMRKVMANEDYNITVDMPFAIAPVDGESKVSIMSARSNTIYYNNYWFNGGPFQFYGTQLNTVVDHNTYEKVMGIVLRGNNIYNFLQPNWYITVCDNHMLDANHLHNVGAFGWPSHCPKIEIFGGGPVANLHLCVDIKNNTMEDGFYINVHGGGNNNSFTDMVIQNNTIIEADIGMDFNFSTASDGICLSGNSFTDVHHAYKTIEAKEKQDAKNSLGDARFVFLDKEYEECLT